jgi:hypothetical protein
MIYSYFRIILVSKIVFISINYQTPVCAVWEKVSTKIAACRQAGGNRRVG